MLLRKSPRPRAGFFVSGAENSPYSINYTSRYFNDVKATFDHFPALEQ